MKTVSAKETRKENLFLEQGDFRFAIEPFWAKWPISIKGSDVLGVAVDAQDNVYATTTNYLHPIVIFSPDGEYIRSIGSGLFLRPHSICFTQKGTMIVSDTSEYMHVCRELDMDGRLIRDYGTLGVPSDTGHDSRAYNTALAQAKKEGKIYPEIPSSGWLEFYMRLDSITKAGKPFNIPTDCAIASTGEMFFSDGYGNAAVHKFDADGNYLETWGGPGKEVGQFRLPHWVNIDKQDRVWVCDRENCRCYVYTTTGDILYLIHGGFMHLGSVWFDSDNQYAYFTEREGGLTILDMEKMEVTAQFGYAGFNILDAHAVYGDSKSNLYIAASAAGAAIGNLYRFRKC